MAFFWFKNTRVYVSIWINAFSFCSSFASVLILCLSVSLCVNADCDFDRMRGQSQNFDCSIIFVFHVTWAAACLKPLWWWWWYAYLVPTLDFIQVGGLLLGEQVGVGIFPGVHFVHRRGGRTEPASNGALGKLPTCPNNMGERNILISFFVQSASYHHKK